MGEPGEGSPPEPAQQRRRYDSRLRRERAARTRDAIVAAGLELAHERLAWDWRGLTIRAAAERAGSASGPSTGTSPASVSSTTP